MKSLPPRRTKRLLALLRVNPDRWSDLTLQLAMKMYLPSDDASLTRLLDALENRLQRLSNGNNSTLPGSRVRVRKKERRRR